MLASHFFTAPTTTTLTGGAAGALIAVVGAFLVARFTLRVERQRDERAAVRDAARQDLLDRHAVAAALARVTAALESETRAAPFLADRTQRAILDAVVEAHRIMFRAHPDVAAWLMAQHAELTALANWSYRIVVWAGFSGHYKRYAERLGMMLGDIQAWVVGQRDDQWFADDLARQAETRTGLASSFQLGDRRGDHAA